MKITDVGCLVCQAGSRNWTFVKVNTDEGVSGVGEATLFGYEQPVIAAVERFAHELVGEDPLRMEHHWQRLWRHTFWRGGPVFSSAISGIEQALWDILGKVCGQPVYQLLGGACRDSIRLYSGIGAASPEEVVERAQRLAGRGITAAKLSCFPATGTVDSIRPVMEAVEQVEAVREAMPPEFDIMVECHGRLGPTMAILAEEELRPYYPLFMEEPVRCENPASMRKLAEHAKIPIAAGERLYTRWGIRELIENEWVSVVQPDVCHCGGIAELRRIAAMAETHYLACAPHNPYGPVATAASLHLDACMPNFLIQEWIVSDVDWRDDIITSGHVEMENGSARLPQGPGLGIELDEAEIAKHPFEMGGQRAWFLADGSVTDT
jgi:galactonate dehydratase